MDQRNSPPHGLLCRTRLLQDPRAFPGGKRDHNRDGFKGERIGPTANSLPKKACQKVPPPRRFPRFSGDTPRSQLPPTAPRPHTRRDTGNSQGNAPLVLCFCSWRSRKTCPPAAEVSAFGRCCRRFLSTTQGCHRRQSKQLGASAWRVGGFPVSLEPFYCSGGYRYRLW